MNSHAARLSVLAMNEQKTNLGFRLALLLLGALGFTSSSLTAAEVDIRRDATVAAVERVLPCVVNIGTKTRRERRGMVYDWFRDNWAPYTQELPPQESAGSGVIIDEEGYVLTNVHVIDGADEIWVRLHDNRIIQASLVTGTRKSDVALLKLRAQPGEKFPAARFAADDDVLLGETVLALGNPFGLGGAVSRGILSAGPRRAPTDDEPLKVADWLQTDAAINPGNSGGPLINLRGDIVGINVAVFRGGQGIGFAIPVKRVVEAISELITPETTNKRLWFGARLRAGALPIRVAEVQPGSPAAQAGLLTGDVVLKINGQLVRSFFSAIIELTGTGEKGDVPLDVLRGNELKKLTVRLVLEKSFFNAELIQKKLGLSLQEMTPALAESLGFTPKAGLLISGVDNDSPAAALGLQPRMLLRGIDGMATTDLVDAAKLVNARKTGEKVKLDLIVQRQRGPLLVKTPHTAELAVR